jgi:predicted nucleotide-binding protein (sugar kinase/HSP70/actin superfamily)
MANLNANFEEILEYLHETLEQNSTINLQECFNEFKEELSQIKIYNKYALHSILKIKFPEEFTYLDSPWLPYS